MYKKVVRFIAAKPFFWFVLALLVVESVWVALTARYPMAFDEDFHLGIIKLYAHQLSPFFSNQPAGADAYGAVVRDPSYLYHYIMSFPYRLIAHLTSSVTAQIIWLRVINVGFMAWGVWLYRKVLLRLGLSSAITNVVLLGFVLTPVVPLLASEINYDNLVFPLSALLLIWTFDFTGYVRKHRRINYFYAGRLVALSALASVVKYSILPIVFAVLVVCLRSLYQAYKYSAKPNVKHLLARKQQIFWKVPQWLLLALIVIAGLGLFVERYGVNTVRYHTPLPECDQVLSVDECLSYSPWARNYSFTSSRTTPNVKQIAAYPGVWVHHSMTELNFVISSNFLADGVTVAYYGAPPLPTINVAAWFVLLAGGLLIIWQWHYFWRNKTLLIAAWISLVYLAALFLQNFGDFIHTGQPVAIHGRYLIPILPLLYALAAVAFSRGLAAWPKLKLAVLIIVGVLVLDGGGILPFIIRSDATWFWPQSRPAQHINYDLRQWLKPVVVEVVRPSTYPIQPPRE